MTPDALPLPTLPSSPATLHGWPLTLARIIWAICAAFAVALFLAYLPFNRYLVASDWLVQSSAVVVSRYMSLSAFTDYVLALRYLTAAVSFGVAALIVWRKSDDAVALMVALGLIMLPITFSSGTWTGRIYSLYGPPWHIWLPRLRDGLTLFAFYYIALLFYIFPDGRFEPRWMKSGMFAIVALDAVLAGVSYLTTGQVSWEVLSITLLIWWLPAIGSQIYRYLRVSGPLERQQTKWFVAAVAFMPIGWLIILLGLSPLSESESNFVNLHLQLAWFLWLPLSVGIGVLRRGLWGVDPIINRTLVYGALTAFVVGAYVVGVGLAGRILQTQESAVVASLALIVVVPLILPLRRWLQRGVDRLLPPTTSAHPPPEAVEPPLESTTRLSGTRLALARWVWWGVTALAISLLAMSVPARFNQLLTVFPEAGTQTGQLSVAEASWLGQVGLSISLYAVYVTALEVLVAVVDTALGVFIFRRKSDDWMVLFVSLALITLPSATPLMTGLVESQPALHGLVFCLRMLGIGPAFYIFYLFPNGRFVPRWTRWLALAWAGYTVAWLLIPALSPPRGLIRVETRADMLLGLWWLSWTAVGVLVQIYRYRHVSNTTERQQTKWIIFGFAATVSVLIAAALPNLLFPSLRQPGVAAMVYLLAALTASLLSFLIVPFTVSLAILRSRLWDIDAVINRALAYGALTTAVVALYIVAVGALGTLFQTAGNVLLSILATGLIAILFNPLRQRLQGAVNRLMYGDRDDPATVLARLGQRLETAVAPEAVLPNIVDTIIQALKVPYVAIRLDGVLIHSPGEAALPAPASASVLELPLIYQSETLGQLLIAPRAPDEAFTSADLRLLNDLARQAAPAVHAYRLTADLQRSRERIVTAREEERRRLRRDLHDGLGPALASQTLKLDAALDLLESDPAQAVHYLREVKAQSQATVADIRRLVYELRPPTLDELGLVGALRAHVQSLSSRNGLRIRIDAPETLPLLSAAVEVAAYRITLEALTNVVKHARARECSLELSIAAWRNQNFLTIEVKDDGLGLAPESGPGVGLNSMRERAEELGGLCIVNNAQPAGVKVLAQLPIGRLSHVVIG